jgi:PAS domain S-box-containing protein
MDWPSLTHPDDLAGDVAQFNRLLSGERYEYSLKKRFLHADGRIITCQIGVRCVRKPDASIDHFLAIVEDITERAQAETALRLEAEIAKNTFEGIGLVRASDGTIVYTNPRFAEIFGYDSGEMLGQHVSILNSNEGQDPQGKALEILKTLEREGAWQGEIKNRRKDGTTFWSNASVTAFDHVRHGWTFVSVHSDITERKQAQKALRQANDELETRVRDRTAELEVATEKAQSADRMKTLFLSTVSHELRTPLNSISGFTNVLLKELSGPLNAEQRKQMALIHSSSEHLVALVNDILDLSYIEAGKIKLVAERFDLNAALRGWMHSLQPQFEAAGLTLRYDLPNAPVPMTGDARRIGQIILNLLGNAVKFTTAGHVEVSLEQTVAPAGGEAPGIGVRVIDTGPGIPPEHLGAIFDPFTRLPSDGWQPKQGSGLGLSISRKLARQMGGTLTVTSQLGKGSSFALAIPMDAAPSFVI